MVPDTNTALNDVLMLTQSETEVTEAYRLGQYQLRQLNDPQVVSMTTKDMSMTMKTVTAQLSKASKNFCDKVFTYLTDSVKFIEKNRDYFESIPDKFVDFYIEGYNFSVLNSPRINFSELDAVMDGYGKFVTSLNKLLQTCELPQESSILGQLSLYQDESNLSNIRANMLGNSSTPIYREDFVSDVKMFYRSGSSAKETIHVHKPQVMRAVDDMAKIKTDIEQTKKEFEYMNSKCNTAMESLRSSMLSIMNAQQKQICLDIPVGQEIDTTLSSAISACIAVLNAKYAQIVTLRNMGEVILGERLTALKDQITQSVEMLNVCMIDARRKEMGDVLNVDTPNIKSISGKPAQLYTMPLTEATDYMEAALDQSILCEAEYNSIIDLRYVQEMEFINSSLENQKIVLMEAGELSNRYQSLKASFIKFIDNIVAAIRKKIVAYNMRYIPWLEDIGEDEMKKKAQGMSSITMAPYYEGEDIVGDLRQIANEIQKAARPANKDSLDFTKKFVDGIDTQEKYDENKGNIPGYLKNYFRFHKKNVAEVKKEEVSGNDLAGKVSNMLKYIRTYENNTKGLANLSKTVERAVADMGAVMDSFNYLQLLECFACDSELGLLEGYQVLLEDASDNKPENDNKEKAGTVTNDKGEAESPTSIETSEQKEKKEAEARGEKPAKSSKYTNTFQHFFQFVISAYVTAAEERFINYVNILSSLSGVRPTVDKNGKYIPRNKKDTSNKKEPTQDSALPQRLYDKPVAMKGASMYKL